MEPGNNPTKISPPVAINEHYFQGGLRRPDIADSPEFSRFYEEIITAVGGASEILLIGHEDGKEDAVMDFLRYLADNHADLRDIVVDAIESNLPAMREAEILALARELFHAHSMA